MTAAADGGLERARRVLALARRVVVLAGAGISTDSGIPDFRGAQGVWTKDPGAERLATLDAYMTDPEVRRRAWQVRLHSPAWEARPNAGHRALVELERDGRLTLLVTQNIDGLHQLAGNDPHRVVEIHGTMRDIVCMRCGARTAAPAVIERVRAGEKDPHCETTFEGANCGGILKSATISFGQQLSVIDLARAQLAVEDADVLLCVGTSLGVYPAAGLVPLALAAGAKVVIANAEATPFDDEAAAVVRGALSEQLPRLVEPIAEGPAAES